MSPIPTFNKPDLHSISTMKYSAALSLALGPVALAKAVHNVYPRKDMSGNVKQQAPAPPQMVEATSETIILVWQNPGGGAPTQMMNDQVTVTTTVTVDGQAAATPAAAATHTVSHLDGCCRQRGKWCL